MKTFSATGPTIDKRDTRPPPTLLGPKETRDPPWEGSWYDNGRATSLRGRRLLGGGETSIDGNGVAARDLERV
ncbi:unnamed protein product, partial [Ectocarpus sp. 4 AP-2014]